MFYRKTVTKILLAFFAFLLIFGNANFIPAKAASFESAPAAATPEQAAVEFYKWYLHELNRNKDPRTRQKQKLLSFLSKRFGKWLYSIPDGEYDADVFIDAQDFDEDWEQSISTSKAVIKGNTARLAVTLGVFKNGKTTQGIGKHVLRLKMVKEGGSWKIDRINDN